MASAAPGTPVIPLNVIHAAALLSDASLNGPSLCLDDSNPAEDKYSKMQLPEAISRIQELCAENHRLKQLVQQLNTSIDTACNKLATFEENERQKEKEHYEKAKLAIDFLKQTVAEKNKHIDELNKQLKEKSSTDCVEDTETLKNELVRQQHISAMCKQQVVQLQGQLHMEGLRIAKLKEDMDSVNARCANLEEQLVARNRAFEQLNRKSVEDHSVMENLRLQISNLTVISKDDKEKLIVSQRQLTQARDELELITSDYSRLKNTHSQHMQAESEIAALKKDYEQRIDNLTAQLVVAEDALALRDDKIKVLERYMANYDKMQATIDSKQQLIDTLNCQMKVYEDDFADERKARENLNDRNIELLEKMEQLGKQVRYCRKCESALGGDVHHVPVVFERLSSAIEETGDVERQQLGAVAGEREVGRLHNTGHGQAISLAHTAPGRLELVRAEEGNGRATTNPHSQIMPSINNWPPSPESQEPLDEPQCPMCDLIFPDHDSLELHCRECIK